MIDTKVPGTAAAEVYQQLLQNLANAGYPTAFGYPFFLAEISTIMQQGLGVAMRPLQQMELSV